MKILFIARDSGGCGFYRMKQPSDFLKRSGLGEVQFVLQHPSADQLEWADLVILQEMGSVNASNIAEHCKKINKPYAAEIDDFLHHVSPHNLGGYGSWNPGTLYVYRAMELVRGASALIVSTPQLAREYYPYNKNIFVIPNYLDREKWDNPKVIRDDDKIRIGWAGGNAHADDLAMISRAIERIVKDYGDKVIFETLGMTRHELTNVFRMDIAEGTCHKCGYAGEIYHHPGVDQNDYPIALSSLGWDIALAPVVNNSFGNAKSDLKIKEYSATGIPIVASSITPYIEAAKSGAMIYLADSYDEWYKAMSSLIDNESIRNDLVKANKEWMESRYIQDRIYDIAEVYKQILDMASPGWSKK